MSVIGPNDFMKRVCLSGAPNQVLYGTHYCNEESVEQGTIYSRLDVGMVSVVHLLIMADPSLQRDLVHAGMMKLVLYLCSGCFMK